MKKFDEFMESTLGYTIALLIVFLLALLNE